MEMTRSHWLRPVEDAQDYTPKVRNRTGLGTSLRHRVPSRKMGNSFLVVSGLEADAAIFLELNPDVRVYCPQYSELYFKDIDGKRRKHRPDFYVEHESGVVHIEVKPSKFYGDFRHRTRMVRAACEQRGERYLYLSERTLRRQPRLSVAKYLLTHRLTDVPEHLPLSVADAFSRFQVKTLGDLERALEPGSFNRQHLLSLASNLHFHIGIEDWFSEQTPVWGFRHR